MVNYGGQQRFRDCIPNFKAFGTEELAFLTMVTSPGPAVNISKWSPSLKAVVNMFISRLIFIK